MCLQVSQLPYLTPQALLRGMAAFDDAASAVAGDPLRAARVDRASLAPLLPILWRWCELQHFSQQRKLRWPLPQSRRDAFENRFAAIYTRNGMGELSELMAFCCLTSPLRL